MFEPVAAKNTSIWLGQILSIMGGFLPRVYGKELEQLQVEDGVATLVISNCTINHAMDKRAVWSEIKRVLKKGGRFVVSDIYSLEPVPAKFANDPVAVAECWAGAITKEEYLSILSETGFKNILFWQNFSFQYRADTMAGPCS